jgi:GNAT superfamily N-acetyltransferase
MFSGSAQEGETHAALRLILGHGGSLADDERVIEFMRFALHRRIDLSKILVATPEAGVSGGGGGGIGGRGGGGGTGLIWALLPVAPAGRSALILAPGEPPETPSHLDGTDLGAAMIRTLVDSLPGLHVAQALVEVNNPRAAAPFLAAGFSQLATLQYLSKRVASAPVPPKVPSSLRLHTYSPATHALFRDAIAASYQGSLDCPALDGVREVDDVIEGHKAAGDFIPALWSVLTDEHRGGSPAAVLLLSPTGNGETLELVYLGVAKPYRRQGLGHWALRQALCETYRQGLPKLTLAVDATNRPALKLYHQFGLQHIHERLALMKNLRA